MADYYVYTYIDPRNFEEFYYGKGKGSRKVAHLVDNSPSAKSHRIHAIKQAGLTPIVRVITRGLTEREALLVEKTLIWKLGKQTTNVATGSFAANFRPHDTMHEELPGFDYRDGIYYYNVGEGRERNWDDQVQFHFISAGQGKRWRDAMLGFNPGDVFAAYLKRHGFVGIGRIKSKAQMIRDVQVDRKPLLTLPLRCNNMHENCADPELSEYVCHVEWLKHVPRNQAVWPQSPKLYTTTHVRASLGAQPTTVAYLEQAFGVPIRSLVA